MSLSSFFDVEDKGGIDPTDRCMPLYTTMDFPDELNPLWPTVRDMSEKDFEVYAEKLRIYFLEKYEKEGFPVGAGEVALDEILDRLQKFNNLNIYDEDICFIEENKKVLKGYNSWGTVVDHWFPEMMDVEITRGIKTISPSVIGVFRDKPLYMRKMKRMLWKDKLNGWRDDPNKPVWPTLKQSIRMGSGTQPVTNIRTPVAKWIYQTEMIRYKDRDELVVYDPSMGWAGRMVSFMAATNNIILKNKKCIYLGTDPNSGIHERYHMIQEFWKKYVDPSCIAEVHPICSGSEDFDKSELFEKYKGKGILAYTSPPYFNRERYSDDDAQSYKKFESYKDWRDGFLEGTMRNISQFLETGARLYWNAADIKISKGKFLPLEKDSIKLAEKYNMKLVDEIKMLMRFTIGRDNNLEEMDDRGSMNIIRVEGNLTKYEPILIFERM